MKTPLESFLKLLHILDRLEDINCIDEIISYSTNRLKLKMGKTELIVSREKVAGFKQWMDR